MINDTPYLKYLNIPFKHLGRSFEGVDCYGLIIIYAKNELGIELDDWYYNPDWSKLGENHIVEKRGTYGIRVNAPEVNDLVCFYTDMKLKVVNHIGILVQKPNTVLQCVKSGVKLTNIGAPPMKNLVEGFYRLVRNK